MTENFKTDRSYKRGILNTLPICQTFRHSANLKLSKKLKLKIGNLNKFNKLYLSRMVCRSSMLPPIQSRGPDDTQAITTYQNKFVFLVRLK